MPDFDIQYSQRGLPPLGPTTVIDVDARTGAGQIGQGIQQLAATVMNVGERHLLIQADSQLSEAKLRTEQEWNRLNLELDKNKDPEAYGKALENFNRTVSTYRPKNGMAARGFDAYINRTLPGRENVITAKQKRRIEDNFKATIFKGIEGASNDAQFSTVRTDIIKGYKLGVFDELEKEQLLQDVNERKLFTNAVLAGDKAYEVVENSGMSFDAKRKVNNQVKDYFNELNTAEKDRVQKAITEQNKSINTFTETLKDPEKHINKLELAYIRDDDLRLDWEIIIDSQGEPSATNTTPEEYLRLESRIFDYWDGDYGAGKENIQTELAFAYVVDKTITKEDYEKLTSRLDENIPQDVRINLRAINSENIIKAEESKEKPKKKKKLSLSSPQYIVAKNTAYITKGLYDWVSRMVSDGKSPTKEEMAAVKTELQESIEEQDIPRVTSKAEYDKLPSGTKFIDPETGKGYIKP